MSKPIKHIKSIAFLLVEHNHKKARFLSSILLTLLSGGAILYSSRLTGRLIERLAANDTGGSWTHLVAPILALEVLSLAAIYFGKSLGTDVANDVTLQIRLALFKKLSNIPMRYFDRVPLGELLTRATSEVSGMEAFLTLSMPRVLTSIIVVALILVFMLFTDFYFGSVVLLSSLPAVLFVFLATDRIRSSLRAYKVQLARLNGLFAEYLQILPLMKVDSFSRYSAQNIGASSEELLDKAMSMIKTNALSRSFANFLCYTPTFSVLFVGGYLTINQELSLGLLVTFLRFSEKLRRPVSILLTELQTLQDASVTIERLSAILDTPEETPPEPRAHAQMPARRLEGRIVFDRVWFSYLPDKPVLKGLSFSVASGSSIGLVGRTGSGKTTTISLISHLYSITQGQITIDGRPLEQWDHRCLRRQIGVVTQNPVVIRGTLRENLIMALACEAVPDDEHLLHACQQTGLLDVMARSSRNLDSLIHDNGASLSAGECQLLAITRVLLRDPSILILDEASAHTDSETESQVELALARLKKGRTSFTIAHRLKSVVECDKLLVFSDGQIVEEGSHGELLKRRGEYFKLYREGFMASDRAPSERRRQAG